jgi:hypothetical protein
MRLSTGGLHPFPVSALRRNKPLQNSVALNSNRVSGGPVGVRLGVCFRLQGLRLLCISLQAHGSARWLAPQVLLLAHYLCMYIRIHTHACICICVHRHLTFFFAVLRMEPQTLHMVGKRSRLHTQPLIGFLCNLRYIILHIFWSTRV